MHHGYDTLVKRMRGLTDQLVQIRKMQGDPLAYYPHSLVGEYLLDESGPGGWMSFLYVVSPNVVVLVLRAPKPDRESNIMKLRAFIDLVRPDLLPGGFPQIHGTPSYELWVGLE